MRLMKLRARRPVGDSAFSLVEAVVALTIATVVFLALAAALFGGAKAGLFAQQNQQAGDVLNQAVEEARALSYEALAMRPADLDVGEAVRTPTLSSWLRYNPTTDTTSGPGLEQLVDPDPNGMLSPHVTQRLENGGTYTVRRYITLPSDAFQPTVPLGPKYKRLTVVVDWTTLGKSHRRTYSTLIAPTKRGLPLPDFKFNNAGGLSQCRNPSSTAVYGFNLKNNGARDAWNLTVVPTSPTWAFYADTNNSGAYEAADDVGLPVAAGTASTGLVEPTRSTNFFAVTAIASAMTTPPPYTIAATFKATSAAQPTYAQDLVTSTVVQLGPCGVVTPTPTAGPTPSASPSPAPPAAPAQPTGTCAPLSTPAAPSAPSAPSGTLVRYSMLNPSQPGDTPASNDLPVLKSSSPPPTGPLYKYSTDQYSAAGRYLEFGLPATTRSLASWTYGMPQASVLKGTGNVTFYAAPANGSTTDRPAFGVRLDLLSSTGDFVQNLGTQTYSTSALSDGCTGLRPVTLQIFNDMGSGLSIAKDQKLQLSIVVTNGVPVRLGYGTQVFPMHMVLPYKTGLG